MVGWCRGCKVGLELEFEAAMAGNRVLWCTHLAEGWCTRIDLAGLFFVNSGKAALDILLEAMMLSIQTFMCEMGVWLYRWRGSEEEAREALLLIIQKDMTPTPTPDPCHFDLRLPTSKFTRQREAIHNIHHHQNLHFSPLPSLSQPLTFLPHLTTYQ